MEHRTEKLLKLANELKHCLCAADSLGASIAAIKILEAHESLLDLADDNLKEKSVSAGIARSMQHQFDTEG